MLKLGKPPAKEEARGGSQLAAIFNALNFHSWPTPVLRTSEFCY